MYTARDYLIREAEAAPSSHPYPRDDGNYLMLLTGVEANFDSMTAMVANLGTVSETYPELGVIVVEVDNDQFVAGSAEKLNNKDDPAFFELNMRELASIDLDRVSRSVERLAQVEPKIYRTDISRMLIDLIAKPGVRFHGEIARALLIWAEDPVPAGKAALEIVKEYTTAGTPVPEALVDLVVKGKAEGAASAIHALWLQTPTPWQSRYVKFGEEIEQDVIAELDAEDLPLRRSALTILGQVGTEKSLPAVRKLLDDSDSGLRILAERAIAEITGR